MCEKGYIDVNVHDYPEDNGYVSNRIYRLECSMGDIIRSCIHAGKSEEEIIAPYEIVFRVAMIRMNLKEEYKEEKGFEDGEKVNRKRFVASEIFCKLDPSEKVSISFFLGMTMAKLIAEKYFHTPWVMHYDVYSDNYNVDIEYGGKPDLFGLGESEGIWNIFEAKGSSDGRSSRAIKKGKEQKKKIKRINEIEVNSSNVVQYYFSRKSKILCIDLADPEINEGKEVKIDYKRYFCNYYGLVCNLIESVDKLTNHSGVKNKDYKGVSYDIVDMPCVDVQIGIPKIVRKIIKDFRMSDNKYVDEEIKKRFVFESFNDGGLSIGKDGIFVNLGETWRNNDQR